MVHPYVWQPGKWRILAEHVALPKKFGVLLIRKKKGYCPASWAPGTSFMGDNFSTGQRLGGGMVGGWLELITFIVYFISIIFMSAPPQIIKHRCQSLGTPGQAMFYCINVVKFPSPVTRTILPDKGDSVEKTSTSSCVLWCEGNKQQKHYLH